MLLPLILGHHLKTNVVHNFNTQITRIKAVGVLCMTQIVHSSAKGSWLEADPHFTARWKSWGGLFLPCQM